MLVAGVDSSTQSCKVVVRDLGTGALIRSGRAPHPNSTEVDPADWWAALERAAADAGGLEDIDALGVGAQQHGMIALDEDGSVVRPALLWNDNRSASAAQDLIVELGDGDVELGRRRWAEQTGIVPVASFTVSKVRWMAEHEPENAGRTSAVALPHDWLSWQLVGSRAVDALTTDAGDASGTGWYDATAGHYRTELLRRALGHDASLPRLLAPTGTVGEARRIAPRALVSAGTGDNAAAALGLNVGAGDVVVSLGTSGVVSAVGDSVRADPSGIVAGFCDATGRRMPLVCTLNGTRVLGATAALLGVSPDELAALALSAPPGAEGVVLIPYLEGERTPNRPHASGAVHGLRVDNATPANLARAAVEGLLCGLADGLDALLALGYRADKLLLIGGGSNSTAVQQIAPCVLGAPVVVPAPGEYVANGAARQAAWALSGDAEPPEWPVPLETTHEAAPTPHVRERYAELRELVEL